MDNTETYIKMCDCPEIQGSWEPAIGDYHWRKYTVFGEELDNEIWGNDNCPEITVLHTKSSVEGYWFAVNEDGESRTFGGNEDIVKCTSIWLPRQDQLQEMVKDRLFHIWGKLDDLYMSASTGNRDSHQVCKNVATTEQLWLAFVMKEKHGKVWSNGEWKTEDK